MNTSQYPSGGIKFAEAAVLFVLILGLTVLIGLKVASHGDDPASADAATAEVQTTAQPSADTTSIGGVAAETTAPAEPVAEVAAPTPAPVPQKPVTYTEAEEAYTAGRYDEAVDLFSDYTQQKQDRAWGHYMLGMSLWKAGDLEGALGSFRTTLDLAPGHLQSFVNTGRVLLALNRPAEALPYLTKAVELAPENAQAQRVLARAQADRGQAAAAEATYRSLLASHPDDVWSLNNLGLLLIRQERFSEALPALARAASLDSSLACVQNNLGVALERSGYITAAKKAYARTVTLDAGYAKAGSSLARLAKVQEAAGLVPFDLAATAAAFDAAGPHGADGALAVNIPSTAPTVQETKPEQPAAKNR